MSDKDRDLSIKEAAAEANVHRNTIRNWIDEKGLPAEQLGFKKTRISLSDLNEFKKKFQRHLDDE